MFLLLTILEAQKTLGLRHPFLLALPSLRVIRYGIHVIRYRTAMQLARNHRVYCRLVTHNDACGCSSELEEPLSKPEITSHHAITPLCSSVLDVRSLCLCISCSHWQSVFISRSPADCPGVVRYATYTLDRNQYPRRVASGCILFQSLTRPR